MLAKAGCSILRTQQNFLRQVLKISQRSLATQFEKCWKCGHKRENPQSLFCEKCQIIQKPSEKNDYFKIFNIQPNYDLDVTKLQKTYRQMQTQLHPDKFANRSEDEKKISAEFSSLVNDAYNTLANPMARALHLLRLHNETILESDKSTDNEFLMEIMELNEAVQMGRTEKDLRQLDTKNRVVMAGIERELNQKFSAKDVAAAKQLVIKMKYYHSLSTKIKEAMSNKGIVD